MLEKGIITSASVPFWTKPGRFYSEVHRPGVGQKAGHDGVPGSAGRTTDLHTGKDRKKYGRGLFETENGIMSLLQRHMQGVV
jgi:hypothetical protein